MIISNELPHTKIFVIRTGYDTSIDIIPVESVGRTRTMTARHHSRNFLGSISSQQKEKPVRVYYGCSACDGFSSVVSVRLSLWIISEGRGSYQEYGPGRYSCQNIWRYLQFLVSLKAGNEKEMKERIGQKRGAVWYLTRSPLELLIRLLWPIEFQSNV